MELSTKLFQNHWHLVCHRKELPADGDFVRFRTPIGDVVVFNDCGNYVAFDNRCAHRGTAIYLTDFGNQANTCSYHGWTFRAGKLIIPFVDQFRGCDISKADLRRYQLDWCGDFMFLGVSPRQSLRLQLDGVAEYIENISFNISGRIDFDAYEYECSWQVALENALEPYHISMVHPTTLATLKLQDGINTFHGANSVWQAPVGEPRVARHLKQLRGFFDIDYAFAGYMSIFMFPFSMISSTFGYSYSVQNFFPSRVRTDRTNFTSRLLVSNLRDEHARKIVWPFFESSAAVNRAVFEEDHAICKLMPTDAWTAEPLKFISEQEIKIAHFRRLCADESNAG